MDSLRSTNTKKGIKGRTPDGKKSKVVLSMFRDSQKEGALEYADWRTEVEEYIKKGYEDSKIKDAMLFSLEGKARQNFWHCDKHGDLTPTEILKRMDISYNESVDFQDLNAQLCGLKQVLLSPLKIITTGWWILVWHYESITRIGSNPES